MQNGTKISVDKKTNLDLNILCAQLDMHKTELLAALSKIPADALREFLEKYDT